MADKLDKWIAEHSLKYPKEFSKMSYSERLDLYNKNRDLYDSLVSDEEMKYPSCNHSEEIQKIARRPAKVYKSIFIKG